MAEPSFLSRILRNPTLRVVAACVFCAGTVFFFQSVPPALLWPVRIAWFAITGWLFCTTFQALRAARFTVKKVVFSLIIFAINWVCLSLLCAVFNALMAQRDDRLTAHGLTSLTDDCRKGIEHLIAGKSMATFQQDIGWQPKPGYKSGNYLFTQQGVRGPKEYPIPPVDPAKRFLCMGDSFTFGTAVGNAESYPAQAEQLLPGSEWVNFGMPATCLTQSYLRYMKDARNFGGKHVIIGFMSNDAQRTVNCFRPFVNPDSGAPLTKPFAKYVDGKFTIEPNPYSSLEDYKKLLANEPVELAKLRKIDYLTWSGQYSATNAVLRTFGYVWEARSLDANFDKLMGAKLSPSRLVRKLLPPDVYGQAIYDPKTRGFKAITAMFERYHDQVVADGREPFIVVFPGPMDVEAYEKKQPRQYASLIEFFKTKHYAYLDFLDPLVAKHKDDLSYRAIYVDNHYQPPVNKEVAEEIIKEVKP